MATLLDLARNHDNEYGDEEALEGDDDDPLDKFEFWRVFKAQVKVLRREMGSETSAGVGTNAGAALGTYEGFISSSYEEMVPLLDAMKLQGERSSKAVSSLAMTFAEPQSKPPKADNRFAHNGSVLNPLSSFAPLVHMKNPRLDEGVWSWGL